MLKSFPHICELSRRDVLQAGYSSLLGLGLSSVMGARAKAASGNSTDSQRSPKSVLLLFLNGAASQFETFDMKLEAPVEIRGDFKPIATAIPGYAICEHLPQLAARANKYAVIRSISHDDNNHTQSTHHFLTGEKQPGGFFDKTASRDDWPCYAGALSFLRRRDDGLPSGVSLPNFIGGGALMWPGQTAGFLGPNFDPWFVSGDPNSPSFKVDALTLAQGMDVVHLGRRQMLLDEINRKQSQFAEVAQSIQLQKNQHLAFDLLTSSRLAKSFEMKEVPDDVRNRYGRNINGQCILLGRRLIEAGVPVVQVNLNGWDHHADISKNMTNMLPQLDQGVSALLDDMDSSGLLKETLVVMMGEFGRTPKINATRGRDHWGQSNFGLFAGAGVLGGQVIGKSDVTGAYPASRAYSPNDVGATIYRTLGIADETEVRDRLGRIVRLNKGEVIDPLFTGGVV